MQQVRKSHHVIILMFYLKVPSCDQFNFNTSDSEIMISGLSYSLQRFKRKYMDITRHAWSPLVN